MMFPGQMMAGGVPELLELTVTLNLQVLVWPAASVAVQRTGVTPKAKVEPLAGVQLAVTPGQLSVTVGGLKLTGKVDWPDGALATRSPEQVMLGGSVSWTVTVKLQVTLWPVLSVKVKVLVVMPVGNVAPLARPAVWVSTAPGQRST
jgi:hypothetical protein